MKRLLATAALLLAWAAHAQVRAHSDHQPSRLPALGLPGHYSRDQHNGGQCHCCIGSLG